MTQRRLPFADLNHEQIEILSRQLDAGDSHSYLVQHLARQIGFVLRSLPVEGRVDAQVALSNKIIDLLEAGAPASSKGARATVTPQAELLLAIVRNKIERPDTPLGTSCLITGTRQDPSLVSQLRKEFETADSVDILCAFIKWSGVRITEDSLRMLAADGKPIRVITTSYMGATDLKAIEALSRIPVTTVKISCDTRRTRLHAKAYMIHRQTGFSVAYIGSSNISQAALTDGLEWNDKISEYEAPHLWTKVCATFETYWNDHEFVSYSADSREQLRIALREERHGDEERPSFSSTLSLTLIRKPSSRSSKQNAPFTTGTAICWSRLLALERRSSLDSTTRVPRRRTRRRGSFFLSLIGKRF